MGLVKWLNSKGWDVDDIFTYDTPKIVRVRDHRLGLLSLTFQLAIFVYVIIDALILSKGYLQTEQIQSGSVAFNAQEPFEFRPLDALPYCCEAVCEEEQLGCLYLDSPEVEFPVANDYSITLTSRATYMSQLLEATQAGVTCTERLSFTKRECRWTNATSDSRKSYIADLEKFSIRIKHGVRGIQIDREGVNADGTPGEMMTGNLVNLEGVVVQEWPSDDKFPNRFGQPVDQGVNRSGDILRLETILQAAGVDLDAPGFDPPETMRSSGILLLLYIEYSVEGSESFSYSYRPKQLSKAEFKTLETRVTADGLSRTLINRHGVRIIAVQTGIIGEFSLVVLLQTLVAGFALLATANIVSNFLMTRVLQMRSFYWFHKYELTEDFSTWRNMDSSEFAAKKAFAEAVNTRGLYEVEQEHGVTNLFSVGTSRPAGDTEGAYLAEPSTSSVV